MNARAQAKNPVSLVFLDPPYGFGLADWDSPESLWTSTYFSTVFRALAAKLLPEAAVVVFGDVFSVLPALKLGVDHYNNSTMDKEAIFVNPVHFVFHKTNKPHKGASGYSHSLENAFLYFFKKSPSIKKLNVESGGNLLIGPRVEGFQQIKGEDGRIFNITQKPFKLLNFFIQNHAIPNTAVWDLTAGSFSSFVACYLSNISVHWAGCDIDQQSMQNFNELLEILKNEDGWLKTFQLGMFYYFPLFFTLSGVNAEITKSELVKSVTNIFYACFGTSFLKPF